jgi:peptide deformylase
VFKIKYIAFAGRFIHLAVCSCRIFVKMFPMRYLYSLILLLAVFPAPILSQNFNASEQALIMSGDTAGMMRVLLSTSADDLEVLTAESRGISPDDSLLPLLSRRMLLTMRDTANPGVGIAAPHEGINRNVFWLQRFDKQGFPFEFLINPRILSYSSLQRRGGEGCLSIPDTRGEVLRSYAIMVEYQDYTGGWHTELLEDFTAVIFQHEYDHLLGTLFTDRISEQKNTPALSLPEGLELFMMPSAR